MADLLVLGRLDLDPLRDTNEYSHCDHVSIVALVDIYYLCNRRTVVSVM